MRWRSRRLLNWKKRRLAHDCCMWQYAENSGSHLLLTSRQTKLLEKLKRNVIRKLMSARKNQGYSCCTFKRKILL